MTQLLSEADVQGRGAGFVPAPAPAGGPTKGTPDGAAGPGGAPKSAEAPPPTPGWSKLLARRGEKVRMTADFGARPGTPVTFKIFPSTSEPFRALSTQRTEADERGVASLEWQVKFDPERHDDPRLVFEASVPGGATAMSPAMLVCDFIEVTLRDPQQKPVRRLDATIFDAGGREHPLTSDDDGRLRVESASIGPFKLRMKGGWLQEGERSPGETSLPSGVKHSLSVWKPPIRAEMQAPKAGAMFLVGDTVDLRAVILRDDKPDAASKPTFRVSGSTTARVEGDRLHVGATAADLSILAEGAGAKASVSIKVVAPEVVRLEVLESADVFPLFEHARGDTPRNAPQALGALAPASVDLGPKNAVLRAHPAAARMGAKLTLRLFLRTTERLAQPARVVVGAIAGDGAIRFLPGAEAVKSGVAWSGEPTTAFVLESQDALPALVRAHDWKVDVRIAAPGALSQPGALEKAHSFAIVPLEIFSIWGKPALADGGPQNDLGDALALSSFDPFHVRAAARWADGGANLLLDDEASIPALVQARLSPYVWSKGYEGKDGLPGNAHPRPLTAGELGKDGVAETKLRLRGVAAYRCAKHPESAMPSPDSTANACPACNAPWADARLLRWSAGSYRCGGCGEPLGDGLYTDGKTGATHANIGRGRPLIARCPACRAHLGTVEVECAACHEWLPERDFAQGNHACKAGGERNVDAHERPEHNWGFGVLDAVEAPGGAPHQAASAMVAALGALGVRSTLYYIRPRAGGAVNAIEHDPITRGAPAFRPARDWGASFMALVAVPVDASRDASAPKGTRLHEAETIAFEPPVAGGARRRATLADALRTGRARKVPMREKPLGTDCRSGHPLTPGKLPVPAEVAFEGENDCTVELTGGGRVALTLTGARSAQAGPLFAFIDGGFRGLLEPSKDLEVYLAAGRHVLELRPENYKSAAWKIGGKLTVSHKGSASGDSEDAIAVIAARVENPKPYETGDLSTGARAALIVAEGALRAQIALSPVHQAKLDFAVIIDDRPPIRTGPVTPGTVASIDLGKVAAGPHTVRFFPANVTWPWRSWEATLTLIGARKRKGPARACPTCGVQPRWLYKCGKCGKTLEGDRPAGKHSCGETLDALVEALVYPCPACDRTVHEEDAECWSCGWKLASTNLPGGGGKP